MHKRQKAMTMALAAALMVLVFTKPAAAAAPVSVQITVEQVFEQTNTAAGIDDQFHYSITPLQPGNPMPVNPDFTLAGSATATLEMTYTLADTYQYEIKTTNPPAGPGYTADPQVYTVTVDVTPEGSDLSAKVIIQTASREKTDTVLFTQRYGPSATDPDLMVDPPVKKTVAGSPAKDSTFTFTLTADQPGQPMPVGSEDRVKTMTITGTGEKDFGTWRYTKAGVYYYTIREADTRETGYEYDPTVYTITDTVREENSQLILDRIVTNRAGKAVESCTFINTYHGSETAGGEEKDIGHGGSSTGNKAGFNPKTGDTSEIPRLLILMLTALLVGAGSIAYLWHAKKADPPAFRDHSGDPM